MDVVEQGVDPYKVALNCSRQFYMWHWDLAIRCHAWRLCTYRPNQDGLAQGRDLRSRQKWLRYFRSLGVSLLAQMVELARRCLDYT
jgi:hypothetical protein